MPISYFVQFNDEKPQQIGGEVLYKYYVKQNTTITEINAAPNILSLRLGNSLPHQFLEIEQGPPVTVTFRSILPRRR